jgi:parallel beta-helix repeat protein
LEYNVTFQLNKEQNMQNVIKNLSQRLLIFTMLVVAISSCKKDEDEVGNIIFINESATAATEAQQVFIDVQEDFIIEFSEGVFEFTNTLSMDGKKNVIIRGKGRDKTFLDFSGQTSGGEGVLVSNSENIRFENITIRDAKGDNLKASFCNRISFVNVGTIWSGTPDSDNGAYGLYPVLCTEVYIDKCYAYGASDAGIYVGQSDKVILKNSVAEGNVAGIEIENTTNADVFNNEAFDNTGGILVFDLPGLTKYGKSVRVFNNDCHDNNRTNFAPPGNIVGTVPAGTGFMLLSTNTVEVFNNSFTDNNFAGVLIASYLIVNNSPGDPEYNPYPYDIYIHNNTHSMTGAVNSTQPALIQQIIAVLDLYAYDQPNILMDGILLDPANVCIKEAPGTTFVNMNAGIDPTFGSVSNNITPHDCTKTPLPEVVFTPY